MTRSHAKKKRPTAPHREQTSDAAIYAGFVIIGGAIVGFAWLLTSGERAQWGAVALGYILALAWLAHLYAWRAHQGRPLALWQRALARIPLRPAGYGVRHGRPLEASHNAPNARRAIMISAVISFIIVIGLAAILIPVAG